jgi:hypothetical protein
MEHSLLVCGEQTAHHFFAIRIHLDARDAFHPCGVDAGDV